MSLTFYKFLFVHIGLHMCSCVGIHMCAYACESLKTALGVILGNITYLL